MKTFLRSYVRFTSVVCLVFLVISSVAPVGAVPRLPLEIPRPEKQISGGTVVQDGPLTASWPWMVDVMDGTCGGTLIHPQWVLTAAHCLEDNNGGMYTPFEVSFVVGGLLSDGKINGHEQIGFGNTIIIHPDYDPVTRAHDLALIEMVMPVILNPYVATLPLVRWDRNGWTSSPLYPGRKMTFTGWGTTQSGLITHSLQLRQATAPIVEESVCEDAYKGHPVVTALSVYSLCTGYPAKSKDANRKASACPGDRGGPGVVFDTLGNWFLAGVHTGGLCGVNGQYGYSVFANIEIYKAWIIQTLDTTLDNNNNPYKLPTVQNGDFESDNHGWSSVSSFGIPLIMQTNSQQSKFNAQLGGALYNGNAKSVDMICQEVLLPPTGAPTLSFDWKALTTGTQPSSDTLKVSLYGEHACKLSATNPNPYRILEVPLTINPTAPSGTWMHKDIVLNTSAGSYGGLLVQLEFRATNDETNPTTFYIDNVSIKP